MFKTPLSVIWEKMEEVLNEGGEPYPVKVKQYKTFLWTHHVEEEPVRKRIREVKEMLTRQVRGR